MSRQKHSPTIPVGQCPEQIDDGCALMGIQISRRLIGYD
jgi:hypothetical protein